MNLNILDAIAVALFSALVGFLVQLFFKWYDRKHSANSFELSVIAEIEAMLSIIEKRQYRKALEQGIIYSQFSEKGMSLTVHIQDNYCPIYYSNLDKISLLSANKVKDIVRFYSILTSLVQDLKPGGLLNSEPTDQSNYIECLALLDEAIALGQRIIK